MPEKVLVTGASGYVAMHCVKLLLDEGYKVKGTVRNLQNHQKIEPLKNLKGAEDNLELVQAELCEANGWNEAVEGCDYVLHVASPFPAGSVASPETLINTAKEGTLNVLKASKESNSVKRVVLTSSMLAVSRGHGKERGDQPFSEDDWTNPEGIGVTPYDKSKVLAEKAAWEFFDSLPKNCDMKLTVLCPGFIVGPLLHNTECASAATVKMLLSGKRSFVPKISFAFTDVRDVAKAHVTAMTCPEAAGERIIIYNSIDWMHNIAKALANEFNGQGYNVPTRVGWLIELWLASKFDGMMQAMLPRHGIQLKIDNSKMKKILKLDGCKSPEESVVDMVYSLIDKGFIEKTQNFVGKDHMKNNMD